MCHYCRNFIGRYALYLPTIVVREKPRLVTRHDTMEADSLLDFKHPESLTREFDSLLPQLAGSRMGNRTK
jgi:hypothetical protein